MSVNLDSNYCAIHKELFNYRKLGYLKCGPKSKIPQNSQKNIFSESHIFDFLKIFALRKDREEVKKRVLEKGQRIYSIIISAINYFYFRLRKHFNFFYDFQEVFVNSFALEDATHFICFVI